MNFGNKINHTFPNNVASLREESTYSSQNNSMYPLNFQSAQLQYAHNASSCSTDSEQTFRQSRVPSPPKETSPKLYSEINRRLNSSKQSHSTYQNVSPGRSPLKGNSMNCSPMKIRINTEILNKSPSYLPLAERFSSAKEELHEKNKELQEVKGQNTKLASEVKSYRDKENKLLGNIEHRLARFNIDLSQLPYMDVINKYQELLNEHKQLLLHSTQIEDLLRTETLRGEEQRAYINVLKQKLGVNVQNSPYLQKSDDIQSLKSTVRYSQKQDEFDARVSEQKDVLDNKADTNQKDGELIKLVDENSRLEIEQIKKERESLLENLKEREVMINELTQENGRLSQEVIKYGKALSEINQKVATKMKDYDSLKGYVNLLKKEVEKQKKTVVLLECDVKEKEERLNERRKYSNEKEYGKGTNDMEEVRKENQVLERKVNILAERITELKELETKWNKLSEKNVAISGENKSQADKEKDRVEVKEIINLKEEVNKLEKKVELLLKEKEVLNETKEELYEMLSKSEEEIDSLKRKLKDKESVSIGPKDQGQNEEIVSFLQEEVKIKQEEIEKLKGFIFNSEVKELVAEGVQATREMFNLEKNLYKKNRPIGSREEGVRKVKENLDGVKAKRKTLEEELFELWNCEKTKYENISKLQQKNFQLQNEVSRLMNELEINCSKYDGPTNNYSSFKQNTRSENETSFSRENQRKSELTRQSGNSRAILQGKNDLSSDQLNTLPISADLSKVRKRRIESEERV